MKRQDRQFRITKFQGKAIAVAVSALFGAMAAPSAFAVAVADGATVAITAAQTVEFTGAAGVLTGTATVADTVNIGAVTSTTNSNVGTLQFAGDSTVTSIGATGKVIGLVEFNGAAGKTVTVNGAGGAFATNFKVGGGTAAFAQGDVTGAVNFAADGTVTLIADKKIVGSVTNTTTNQGTLTFATTATDTVLVSGTTGSTGAGLKAVNVTVNTGKTATFTGLVTATTTTVAGVGTTAFTGGVTGALNINANGALVTSGQAITGAVDNTTGADGRGKLTLAATKGVTGAIGATNTLLEVVSDSTGGTTAFVGAVKATTVTVGGTGNTTYAADVTGAVNFTADGTITVAADKKIVGSVATATTNTGTLTFAATANDTVVNSGATGATGKLLKAVNVAPATTKTATLTGAVFATTITHSGAGTVAFGSTVTGDVKLTGGGLITGAGAITGTVDNTGTTGTGTLTMAATQGVTGAIGSTAALALVTSNSTGGTSAFGGAIKATNISLTGTGIATFAGNLTGAVNFTVDGTATVATGANIIGAVTTTNTSEGTLNFAGTTTTGGAIGVAATPKVLKAVNFAAGTVSIGHDISATNINFNGTTSAVFTAAKTLTGVTAAAAGTTLDVGAVGVTNTGNFSTAAGTTIKTALTSATATGAIAVTGTGTIAQTTKVFVNVGSFAVVDQQKFKLVNSTAGNGTTGLDAGMVTTNSAVLSFVGRSGNDAGTVISALGTVNEDLYLVATRAAGGFTGVSGISSTAPGASALSTLNAIALLPPAVGSDMATVVNTFNGYSAAQLLSEAPKLAPTTGAAQIGAGIGTVGLSLNVVYTRMASIRGDSSQLASGAAASGVSAGSAPGREFWAKGFGSNTSQNSYDGFSGYSGRSYGLAFGADTDVGSNTRLGLGLSYAKTNVGFSNDGSAGAGSNVSVNTYQITGYGTRDFGQAYVDGLVSYARHNTSGNRLVALARQATYSTNANQWSARIGAGYHIPMSGKTMFTPLASLEWTNFNQNSYTESGAGALSLNVDSLRVNRTKGGVGFRVSGESTMASGTVFKPELHMGVYNDFNNGTVATTSSFTGGGGSFSTNGQSVQRTSYNVGAGVTFMQGRSGSVGVVYDYESRSSFKGHNFQVQGRWAF